MRAKVLLLAISCVACAPAPTETVVVRRQAVACAQPVACTIVADTSTIWVDGMKYLHITEQCHP